MNGVLKDLKPTEVFKNFEQLTMIPRGSGNEKQVSDYLKEFGEKLGLETNQDKNLNIIIKKPATEGYENSPTVILQGHMDIVCAKDEDKDFDFEKDPIPLIVDGDMIRTEGTTLGADNGIAIAMAMSLLESKDIPHPPLVALFTVSEETTMVGAEYLEPGSVVGDILINIDSEEEGIITTSCAGGVDNIVELPIMFEKRDERSNKAYKISVKGLLGGHSGMEIDKNRANANILIGRVLDDLREELFFDIWDIKGGEKINAIPKFAEATIGIDDADKEELDKVITKYNEIFKNEYKTADPDIILSISEAELIEEVFSLESKNACIDILRVVPNGVYTMSSDIKGLVESSLSLGVLEIKDKSIVYNISVRSSVHTLKEDINSKIEIISHLNGAKMRLEADYPEWEYKKDSEIRDLMVSVYKQMYDKDMKIEAVHAGLECGFFEEKIGNIDMVSIGPDIFDVHTPREHLSISSTKRVYEFLCEVLKELKK